MKKIAIGSMASPMGLLARMLGGGYNNTRLPRKDRPTDSRHWHNINDPAQRKRLQAAEAKRERKADKLHRVTLHGVHCNHAHHDYDQSEHSSAVYPDVPARLNPLYINRSEVM